MRTCPSVLAKISSLSTTAVLHMPDPAFQFSVGSVSVGCTHTVWEKKKIRNPSRGHVTSSWHSCQIRGCQSSSTGFCHGLDHNGLKHRNVTWPMTTHYSHQDAITIWMFQSFQMHTTVKAASSYFYVWDLAQFDNQVPPSLTATPLASLSTVAPRSSGNVSGMCHCGVPLDLWITIQSHSFGFAMTFGCLSRKNKTLSLKQNKSALSLQITVHRMEVEQNFQTETENSMVLILARC